MRTLFSVADQAPFGIAADVCSGCSPRITGLPASLRSACPLRIMFVAQGSFVLQDGFACRGSGTAETSGVMPIR
jgi:hypothetical protein